MGTTGLETAFAAVYTELVVPGVLPLALVVEKLSAGAALMGLPMPRIAVGAAGRAAACSTWRPSGRSARPATSRARRTAASRAAAARPRARHRRGGRRRLPRAGVRLEPPHDQRLRPARGRHALRRRGLRRAAATRSARSCSRPACPATRSRMTDPSFHAQLITFTAPMVGNYGVSAEAMESDRVHARAAIMREAVDARTRPSAERGWLDWLLDCGVPGITGVDTRALVRHIRDAGAMLGGVFPGAMGEDEARALIAAEPPMTGRDLAREVTPREPRVDRGRRLRPAHRRARHRDQDARSCATSSRAARRSSCCRARRRPTRCSRAARTGSSSCPGPATRRRWATSSTRCAQAIGRMPVFGICLGHQILSQAVGLETFKLPFGHRGGNHPVKDLRTGRIAITAAEPRLRGPRRGRAAAADRLRRGRADPRQPLRRHDRGASGCSTSPAGCVQYHPEAGPGPHDSRRAVRRVPRGECRACRGGTTCTRSSCSARARS